MRSIFLSCAILILLSACGSPVKSEAVAYVTLSGSASIQDEIKIRLIDSVTSTCAFTTDSGTANTANTKVQIVTGASPSLNSCANKNACILCTTAASGSNCSIACTGTIPSNTATAADTFNIYVTHTATITSAVPNTLTGVVRTDGSITNWSEFAFNGQPSAPLYSSNMTQCTAPYMTFNTNNTLGIAQTSASSFNLNGRLTGAGSGGTAGTCTFSYSFRATMGFTGAATPGTAINLSRGSLNMTTKICETSLGC